MIKEITKMNEKNQSQFTFFSKFLTTFYQAGNYMFKLTIETLEQRCEIYSKLTIKPLKRRHRRQIAPVAFKRSNGFPKKCFQK